MIGTGLWYCSNLHTAGKWIAALLNIMAVTGSNQCLTQLSYLPTPCFVQSIRVYNRGGEPSQ